MFYISPYLTSGSKRPSRREITPYTTWNQNHCPLFAGGTCLSDVASKEPVEKKTQITIPSNEILPGIALLWMPLLRLGWGCHCLLLSWPEGRSAVALCRPVSSVHTYMLRDNVCRDINHIFNSAKEYSAPQCGTFQWDIAAQSCSI
jgi:hypothetical protein